VELNIRIYVTVDDRPVVLFFFPERGEQAGRVEARRFFDLPYFHAPMRCERTVDGWPDYHSRRTYRSDPPTSLSIRV